MIKKNRFHFVSDYTVLNVSFKNKKGQVVRSVTTFVF